MSLIDRVLSADLLISERWRRVTDVLVLAHSIFMVLLTLAATHVFLVGPGVGDEFTFHYMRALLQEALTAGHRIGLGPIPFLLLVGLICVHVVYRALMAYRGYREYENWSGRPYPINDYLVYTLMNLLNAFFLPAVSIILGVVALWFGFSFADGWEAADRMRDMATQAIDHVPTIFHLPRIPAFLASVLAITFVHYWMHRISHTRRFMWLMFHRPHHMPENMCAGAVLPFVMAFPLSLFIIMPYVFVFGSISRLFYPEPLYYEMTIFVLIFWIAEVHNHNPALYEKTIRTRWIRWLSFAFCNGPYHLLHHAADRDERFRKSAWTANFGLAFFCIWDFLFGTFRPIGETLPELGLTDRPRLVLNPVRLIFSGISQLLYELYWNKSWRDRFLIVFGRADYYPPISKDFALYRDLGKRVNASIDVLHRPQQTGAKA